jgi:hypothetical protein
MKTKTILKQIMLVSILCFSLNKLNAQQNKGQNKQGLISYPKNSIGLRLGGTSGLDYKHRFNSLNSGELIIGAFPYAFGVTGLYERNILTTVDGLNLYIGAGMHVGQNYHRRYVYFDNGYYRYRDYNDGARVGIDGIFGIEYQIPDVPLQLSLDIKPYTDFYRYSYFSLDPGLGIKYTF